MTWARGKATAAARKAYVTYASTSDHLLLGESRLPHGSLVWPRGHFSWSEDYQKATNALSRARLKGSLPLISAEITRFVITLGQGIDLVWHAFDDMSGREIYQRIPSMKVADIVRRRAGRWAGTRRQRSGTL